MTRQFKSTDEEMREHKAQLEQRIDQNKDEIETLLKQKAEILREKNQIEQKKNDEIKELQSYIDQMHTSFAGMLKKTLEKMKERIKLANDAWEDE